MIIQDHDNYNSTVIPQDNDDSTVIVISDEMYKTDEDDEPCTTDDGNEFEGRESGYSNSRFTPSTSSGMSVFPAPLLLFDWLLSVETFQFAKDADRNFLVILMVA
jgi:hypothetical protein